ncbi:CDGSH iron-sulfur domain-containing protein [Luteolibacter yonseiensis]|uniref:CDGSH iron-sulfur domain-containing protein n=1 Tax=Luteolibacter yonseiensis TaxID=1144680 RepID=A0A934VBF7_9BACT|nr:CDGSH iron-sulfur domain-containing protein [Luteolibacter yonseiensis]MBK1815886.1 CDGSH iron-sulfur domain-containing protein [Luteolibacter yonseiensis]
MAAKPIICEVGPGIHWWCSCGRTSHPPFCDGSHKGTGRQPVKFNLAEKTTVRWCRCELTGDSPDCGGPHPCLPPQCD